MNIYHQIFWCLYITWCRSESMKAVPQGAEARAGAVAGAGVQKGFGSIVTPPLSYFVFFLPIILDAFSFCFLAPLQQIC